jgi:hypothetical protein
MSRTHLVVPKLLAAALALAGAAASAQTWTSYPGAACSSDGAVQRPSNGSLLNLTPQLSGYSTFSCPVPRDFPTSGPTPTTYVYVNFKATDGPADFFCVLRSVDWFGDVSHSSSLTVPKAWQVSNVKDVWGGEMQVSGPSHDAGYSVVLRCQVPNYLSMPGGIISYRVRH